jgi:hypothetical protein
MSLTSLLNESDSNISQFFEKNFDLSYFLEEQNNAIKNAYTLKPKNMSHYPWSTVGHIVEYLFMLHNGIPFESLFPIHYGMKKSIYVPFCSSLSKKYSPFLKKFSQPSFSFPDLIDDLYRLAEIESILRNNQFKTIQKIQSSKAHQTIQDDVLQIYEHSICDNLVIKNHPGQIYYNPTFGLSSMVNGADADFYIIQKNGNFLVDLKTTIKPKIEKDMLFQLLGYAFLDFPQKHKIQQIGIYLTRQNLFSNWNILEIIQQYSHFKTFEQAQNSFVHSVYLPQKKDSFQKYSKLDF